MSYIPDEYTRRARVYPMGLVFAPIALTVLGLYTAGPLEAAVTIEKLLGSSAIVVVSFFFAMIGRDWGKKKQQALWDSWGGAPTTAALRFRGAANKVAVERRHRQLGKLVPDVRLPMSEEMEANDPEADQKYEACIEVLSTRTRDPQVHRLIFEENCSYGAKRNLYGYKPLAVAGCVAAVVVFGLRVWWDVGAARELRLSAPVIGLIASLALLAFWVLWVRAEWVRAAAVAYAERLLQACETLEPPEAPTRRILTSERE
jgi:hypothetical protein